jgi:hypothetical protein
LGVNDAKYSSLHRKMLPGVAAHKSKFEAANFEKPGHHKSRKQSADAILDASLTSTSLPSQAYTSGFKG